MGIFNKKESKNNEFTKPQQVSGGNLFNVDIKLKVQEEINKQNSLNVENNNRIKGKLKTKLDKFNIPDFYLLQLQANYFVNTVKYKTDNLEVYKLLPLVIRLAFIDGMSGIYYDRLNDKLIPIYIGKLELNDFGEIEKLEYLNAFNVIFSYEWLMNDKKVFKTLTGEECKNVAIFKWGQAAISCWMVVWKFVQFQNQLLRMMVSNSYLLTKKYVYNVENQFSLNDEMDMFFDPDLPFLKVNKNLDLNNKMKVQDNTNNIDMMQTVEYYKGMLSIYYALIGRKINQDAKKERNLAGEIETNTQNFKILERDWLVQFDIFCKELKEINPSFIVEPFYTLEKDFMEEENANQQNILNPFDNKEGEG